MADTGRALARYDVMRREVAACARVDEAAKLRNQAMALKLYARQSNDPELHRWMSEIQLRALLKVGELSGRQETGHKVGRGKGRLQLPSTGKLKEDALTEAGISTSVAQRAEALTGRRRYDIDDESGLGIAVFGAALETADVYFDQCRKAKVAPNYTQLNTVIDKALDQRFGKPKAAPRRPHRRSPEVNAWIDWTGAVRHLATAKIDLVASIDILVATRRNITADARAALPRLKHWLKLLEAACRTEPEE